MARIGKAATTLRGQARRGFRVGLIAGSVIPLAELLLLYLLYLALPFRAGHLVFGAVAVLSVALTVALLRLLRPISSFMDSQLRPIAGYGGERRVFEQLRSLPDDYWIFNDVEVRAGDHKAQIDHVLVGPCGVWCIETKSDRGRVSGKEEGAWRKTKESERGVRYPNEIGNPICQNARHCQILSAFLKSAAGFAPPIQSLIVFTRADLNVDTETPVISTDEVVRFIQARDAQPSLQPRDVQRIVEALQTGRAKVDVTTLYVGSLGEAATESQLWELFAPFGPVAVRLQSGKGYGFVDVPQDQADAAKAALNGRSFNGRTIKVNDSRRGNGDAVNRR